jgi:Fic family protein
MVDRSSEADEPELSTNPDERARVEAENSLRQFDAAMVELRKWLRTPGRRLRPSDISALQRVLMERLSEYAGVYRPAKIKIGGSRHTPPPAEEVQGLVEDLCEYVNEHWNGKTPVHLAAYVLWRVNWIHPFTDGNGRTARVVSYLVLSAKSGQELPGDLTIPEQISRNKQPYYAALEAADRELRKGKIDVSALEELLNAHLANQLYDFYQAISGDRREFGELPAEELVRILEQARNEGAEDRAAVYSRPAVSTPRVIWKWAEENRALVGLLTAVALFLLGWLIKALIG